MREIVLPADELNEFDLPRVCVVTGQTDGVGFHPVKFAWYPRWVAVFVLINLLLAAIIALALTKRVKGQLPFTEEAFRAWRRGVVYFNLSLAATIGLFVGGIALLVSETIEPGLGLMGLSLAVPIFVWVKFLRNRGPVVQRIADGRITLKLPSHEAVRLLKEHLVAGRQGALRGSMKQSA